jgi:hypothetical protein
MTIVNSLFPVVSNIFIKHFEEIALDTADHKPAKCTSVVWQHGAAIVSPPQHLRPTIKFTMKVEADYTLPFLDVLVMKKGPKLATKCTGNLTLVVICTSTTHIT